MLTLTSVFQRFIHVNHHQHEEAIPVQVKSQVVQEAEDQRDFLLSVAHLPVAEREKRIQHREALKQIVARQGIMEVEAQANQYWTR